MHCGYGSRCVGPIFSFSRHFSGQTAPKHPRIQEVGILPQISDQKQIQSSKMGVERATNSNGRNFRPRENSLPQSLKTRAHGALRKRKKLASEKDPQKP
ncbi:hypothetical protein T265_02975 [Opisthorchis viverrini]|uniref:Uncharacterized protein n=1 Tax=Opisthorchis viverrini TaxID=6198 RepID=A0A074ZT84_OPIVI|nr:hypothetical protein T265_02975 [Opisthorchis viverrini]KER30623.1 hypothetical protein T265_02975 [Opisthorchis viverrini]